MKKYTITEEDYHFMWDKIHSLENENSRLKGYIKGLKEQLRTLDVVGRRGKCNCCEESTVKKNQWYCPQCGVEFGTTDYCGFCSEKCLNEY